MLSVLTLHGTMATIELGYGHDSISFEYDAARFDVLTTDPNSKPLNDAEIGAALDMPIVAIVPCSVRTLSVRCGARDAIHVVRIASLNFNLNRGM
jgi:hypothetical protein